jgi:hypothetical protein
MGKKHYYSPRDVDQLIPRLEKIFKHIDACKQRAHELAETVNAMPDVSPAEIAEKELTRARIHFLLDAVQDDVEQILRLGGVTKDLDAGLVDFPSQVGGQEVWLCWKRGETKIRFWHALNEGFSQRQTLERPQPRTTLH